MEPLPLFYVDLRLVQTRHKTERPVPDKAILEPHQQMVDDLAGIIERLKVAGEGDEGGVKPLRDQVELATLEVQLESAKKLLKKKSDEYAKMEKASYPVQYGMLPYSYRERGQARAKVTKRDPETGAIETDGDGLMDVLVSTHVKERVDKPGQPDEVKTPLNPEAVAQLPTSIARVLWQELMAASDPSEADLSF